MKDMTLRSRAPASSSLSLTGDRFCSNWMRCSCSYVAPVPPKFIRSYAAAG